MLETNDRIRLIAALRDLHSPEQELEEGDSVSRSTQPTPDPIFSPPIEGATDSLSSSDSESMRMFLSEQPDWVCALLVADARWPWVGDYLAGLDADKLMRLEALVRRLSTTVKPRVRVAVAEIVNKWLSTNDHRPLQESAFDMLLARLRQNESAATVTGSSV